MAIFRVIFRFQGYFNSEGYLLKITLKDSYTLSLGQSAAAGVYFKLHGA